MRAAWMLGNRGIRRGRGKTLALRKPAHANDVLTMVAHAMGDTIQIVAQAYDPQRIIIGGGMAKTGDALIEVIQAELSRRAEGCRFLTTLDIASNIRIAAIDQPIGAIGAALAAKRAQPQS